jgi:hypothetical protein
MKNHASLWQMGEGNWDYPHYIFCSKAAAGNVQKRVWKTQAEYDVCAVMSDAMPALKKEPLADYVERRKVISGLVRQLLPGTQVAGEQH